MATKKDPFYITTPIYYVNDAPHLGTAYCTIGADVLARYARLTGKDVLFLTGTDEHGEKIQEAASKKNKTPQEFVDEVAKIFEDTWNKMGISFDDFIRTTEKRHVEVVKNLIAKALKSGDIYLGNYEGWYCVPDETFWTESQLNEGKCPTCGRDVKKIKEENYFFKLTKYKDQLLQYIEKNPDFILPVSKKNEVVAFLKEDLRDVSVSRTSFTWGIEFPEDTQGNPKENHIMYVWFDALINYLSALNPLENKDQFNKFWGDSAHPKAIHLIGKDILRFHAVYWPCFLMSVGLPLPKRIFAHGWWTIEGQKMSKSLGNTIDPIAFTEEYGQDAFRLFLFREFPMGQDGDFSLKNFKERSNADLANNLGNLVSRTLTLMDKNLDGQLQPPGTPDSEFAPVTEALQEAHQVYLESEAMEKFEYHDVLNKVFAVLLNLNKYINIKTPWKLAKEEGKKEELASVLNQSAEAIRLSTIYLSPFIPTTSVEILRRLGQKTPDSTLENFESLTKWGGGQKAKVEVGSPIFPRMK